MCREEGASSEADLGALSSMKPLGGPSLPPEPLTPDSCKPSEPSHFLH